MNKDFNLHQGPFLITPYALRGGLYGPEILIEIYGRLKDEGLFDTIFHDNPQTNILDFMEFLSSPSVMVQLINVVVDGKVSDLAGISWLSGVEQYGDKQRGVASFCVFKDYQTPTLTDPMAKLILGYWFERLGMDIVVGMTPAANHLSVPFIKRIGFIEACRIPGYSFLKGQQTDCVIAYMDKAQYQTVYGG